MVVRSVMVVCQTDGSVCATSTGNCEIERKDSSEGAVVCVFERVPHDRLLGERLCSRSPHAEFVHHIAQ